MIKLNIKRERMLSLIAAWPSSNQSKSRFCQENNVNESTFDYWRRKCRRETSTNGRFIQVVQAPLPSKNIEVHYPNGVRIVASHDLTLLSELIHLY